MLKTAKRIGTAALIALGAAGALGCELIAKVDRSLIPSAGGAGAGGSPFTTGTGGTGGAGGGAVCGDGILEPPEQCDDGNTISGDGCDPDCKIEAGYTCAGQPSVCTSTCGDGVVAGDEQCDDGNTKPGDGCSAICTIEPGYTCTGAPSVCTATCGDGIVTGAETCDDGNDTPGDGCSATCTIEKGWSCSGVPSACKTVCGDGIVAGAEECDDGANNGLLDGCNDTCKKCRFVETEPNDTPAQASGPFTPDFIVFGAVVPTTDVDWFAVNVPATADLHIETFDQRGPGSCANIDTVVTFYGTDGATVLATDDDGGIHRCSLIDSAKTAAVRHLPAGVYYVKVESFNHYKPIAAYSLVVQFNALCGDGKVQGAEQCDGGMGCTPTCDKVQVCGDGFVEPPEQCDDGNKNGSGGACSAACTWNILQETEPDDTSAHANGPYQPNVLLGGSINPATDVDWFAIRLPATADLKLETFDGTGPGSCAGIDTVLSLYAPDGATLLLSRDQGGLGNCSAIDPSLPADSKAARLPAGTYYVSVQSFGGLTTIPAYTLLASYEALCGNGVVEGSEQCDGTPGCTASCTLTPVCGDGIVEPPEQCDDGNTTSGDGCSATCQLELLAETEPNDTPAQASGPFSAHALIQASISPNTDVDYFAVAVPSYADLQIQTWDGNGPGSCDDVDTAVTLFAPDGTTQLAQEFNSGLNGCTLVSPKFDPGTEHLAPGTYYVMVESFDNVSALPAYRLELTFTALCGNGVVEGSEECDGTPGCDATCHRVQLCGDGYVEPPEQCDDGNTTSGDGCSATCQLESHAEVEPDDTTAEADASPVQLSGSGTITGSIGTVGDVDVYRLTLAQTSVVRLETFDTNTTDCTSIATTLRFYDAGGTELYRDDNSGIGSCSAIVLNAAAGTYYVSVEQQGNTATIPAYVLQVRVEGDDGSETEPNDTAPQANAMAGSDVFVLGDHTKSTDVDFFRIDVPTGKSVRAEVVEGGGATCESLNLDSYLTLYDNSGLALEQDDDSGRGFCSLIDGTGSAPVNAGASGLPGGTYYLAVEASPFAEAPGNPSGSFVYRLVVTIR
jgi:cysteine-rich repeat protein